MVTLHGDPTSQGSLGTCPGRRFLSPTSSRLPLSARTLLVCPKACGRSGAEGQVPHRTADDAALLPHCRQAEHGQLPEYEKVHRRV